MRKVSAISSFKTIFRSSSDSTEPGSPDCRTTKKSSRKFCCNFWIWMLICGCDWRLQPPHCASIMLLSTKLAFASTIFGNAPLLQLSLSRQSSVFILTHPHLACHLGYFSFTGLLCCSIGFQRISNSLGVLKHFFGRFLTFWVQYSAWLSTLVGPNLFSESVCRSYIYSPRSLDCTSRLTTLNLDLHTALFFLQRPILQNHEKLQKKRK